MDSKIAAESLAAFLRRHTWDLHQRAEKHPGHGALFRGRVPFDFFLDQSAQTLLVQRVMDAALSAARRDPVLATLVEDYHIRSSRLEADLVACGRDVADVRAMPPTAALLARIDRARAEPAVLLGVLYVLEGSTNGAGFIARALRRAFGESAEPALRWLDPHGDQQAQRWQRFREALDRLTLSEAQREMAATGARETFAWTIAVLDELCVRYGVQTTEPVAG